MTIGELRKDKSVLGRREELEQIGKSQGSFWPQGVGNAGHKTHCCFYLHTPVCMSVFACALRTHWSEQERWNDGGVGNG